MAKRLLFIIPILIIFLLGSFGAPTRADEVDSKDLLKRLERLENELNKSQQRERLLEEKVNRLEQKTNVPKVEGDAKKQKDAGTPAGTANGSDPSPRSIDWEKQRDPLTPFRETFGSDLDPPTAKEQTRDYQAQPTANMVKDMRAHEEPFYREGPVRDWVLGGFDFQGFVDVRFIFDEDVLFDEKESFDFNLHEVELDIIKKFPKLAYLRADIDFSTAGATLEQGYVGLDMPWFGGLDFRMGRFNSPIGTEGPDIPARIFISPSMVKGLGLPENFMGVQLAVARWELMKVFLIFANGWEVNSDVNDSKSFAGRLELYPMEPLVLGFSGGVGPEQINSDGRLRKYVEFDAIYTPHPRFDFTFDFTYGQEDGAFTGFLANGTPLFRGADWWGVQTSMLLRMLRWLDFAIRYEYFTDDNSARVWSIPLYRSLVSTFPGESVSVHSWSALWRIHFTEGADINIEYVHNNGEGRIFQGVDGLLDGQENVITFQFVYKY